MKGYYIALEGIDGSGKTTLANNLCDKLNDIEKDSAIVVKEPFNKNIIELISKIKKQEPRNEDEILANLFAADRLLLKEKIFDYMYDGITVISDRSKYSSFAYQSVDYHYNALMNQYMMDPHAIFYLDIRPDKARERYKGEDKFENSVFLEKVRSWYLKYLPQITSEQEIHFSMLDVTPYNQDQVTSYFLNAMRELDLI